MKQLFFLIKAFLFVVLVGSTTAAIAEDHPKYFDIVGFYIQNGVYTFRDLSTGGKMLSKSSVLNTVLDGDQLLEVDFDINEFENKYLYCGLGGRLTIDNTIASGMCNFVFNGGKYSFEQVGKVHCEWNCLRKDAIKEMLTEGNVRSKK